MQKKMGMTWLCIILARMQMNLTLDLTTRVRALHADVSIFIVLPESTGLEGKVHI